METLTLSNANPKKSFICRQAFSGITITKIFIENIDDKQVTVLPSLCLKIVSSGTLKHTTTEETISIRHLLTPTMLRPIFDYNLFVPKPNKDNMKSLSPFHTNLEIELIDPSNDKDVSVVILYDETPGVEVL